MHPFKIVILGMCGVGKSSIMKQLMNKKFIIRYEPTVEDFYTKVIEFPDRLYRAVDIYDTSGTNEFLAMKRLRIDQGEFFIVIYAVDDLRSFNEAMDIMESVRTTKGIDIPLAVIGNKVDLSSREVTPELVSEMQLKLGFVHMETSAKKNINLEAMLHLVLKARFPCSESSQPGDPTDQEEQTGDDDVFTPPQTPSRFVFKRTNSFSVFSNYLKPTADASPREKRYGSDVV